MNEKVQYFDGKHFTRDDKTGYYLNSTIRERMHRYVWKFYNGEIPKGYEIHHIDENKSNNNIENLMILSVSEHKTEHMSHSKKLGAKNVESGHLENIRELTKEWHKSQEGKEWHMKHYERTKDKLHEMAVFNCESCGKDFEAEKTGNNRFCSNKCKSAWRRKSGVDDIEKECPVCGRIFKVNRYSKTRSCSRQCGAILRKESKSS